MKPMIDLCSDTVTQPTPAMCAAIAAAPLGDDEYGDDPSVNALQEKIAGMLGFEGALFVPTGTQCKLPRRCSLTGQKWFGVSSPSIGRK